MTLEDHANDWESIQGDAKALGLKVYELVNTAAVKDQAILCERIRHDVHSVMSFLSDAVFAPNQRMQCTYMGVAEDKICCLGKNLEEAGRLSVIEDGVVKQLIDQFKRLLKRIDGVLRSLAEDSGVTSMIAEYESLWASKSDMRFRTS